MLKRFFVLLIGIGISVVTVAQCSQHEVYKTATKGGNARYLRDFNNKINKNSSDTATVNLTKGRYRLIHYNNLTSYFELRDENNTLIQSTFIQDTVYAAFDFVTKENSTYKLTFFNRTDQKICSVTILGFLGKHSNFIGISSDTSLLSSGKHLDFSCCNADSLPDLLNYCKITEVLDISFNNFRKLPTEIHQFEQLKKLSLSGNINLDANQAIKYIPYPEKIEVLDLSSLYFYEFPKELNRFSNLKSLSLDNTRFGNSTYVGDVFLLESLENLSVGGYHFRKKTIPKYTKSNLKILNLYGYSRNKEIKRLLKALPKLERMNLQKTMISNSKIEKIRRHYPNVTITFDK